MAVRKKPPTILLRDSYLAMIQGSVGAKMFQRLYLDVHGTKTDILERGSLSCAYYVSSVLYLFGLIRERHATVQSTLRDLRRSGWRRLPRRRLRPGAILSWEPTRYDDGVHGHLGFFVGNHRAVSTSFRKRTVLRHDMTYNGARRIETILWHPKLNR